MNTTLKDLLHAINILGYDSDVCVDGEDSICVVPPVKMTSAGLKHFEKALNAKVVVTYENDEHQYTFVSDDDESVNSDAFGLLASFAGYCGEADYKKWFEGTDSKLI